MIHSLLRKFQTEQLNANMDISLSQVVMQDTTLVVIGKVGGIRLIFSAIFIVPGFWLVWQALATDNPVVLIAAGICCPVLFSIGLLLGFLKAEKSFDTAKQTATKSISLFQFQTVESENLSQKGIVKLWSEWDSSGEGPGYWWHNVTVEACRGFNFTIARDYVRARSFAEQLAQFLRYKLTDVSEPRSHVIK